MALILKYSFIDVTDNCRKYEAGDDVSHVSEAARTWLTLNYHVEVVEDENVGKKPKKK